MNFNVLAPAKHIFILEEERRSRDDLELALDEEVQQQTAGPIPASERRNQDARVEDQSHFRRLRYNR
jgi:hypothetical protein